LSMAPGLASEAAHLRAEIKELEMLGDSTQTEITRLQQREDQAKTRYDSAKKSGGQELVTAADEYLAAQGRRMTMESQLAALNAKRKLLDRVLNLIQGAQTQLSQAPASAPAAPQLPPPSARFDESKLLQAVVDTQEEERRRIARQVHDGPAQAMANVVLQSEISERLYDVDPARSRQELAGLRLMVNKTLQELRGFIFELRPMILDDLGLVPTLRRYIQTLVDKHSVKIDFASNGRDRRLAPEEEVAIFRLIQDSVIERIERGAARDISIATTWRDQALEIMLQSDGKELPADGELASGLRRSERLELLKGESEQDHRPDGTTLLQVRIPIRAATPVVS
jgi:two-component system sensor histidine kinase DegS